MINFLEHRTKSKEQRQFYLRFMIFYVILNFFQNLMFSGDCGSSPQWRFFYFYINFDATKIMQEKGLIIDH